MIQIKKAARAKKDISIVGHIVLGHSAVQGREKEGRCEHCEDFKKRNGELLVRRLGIVTWVVIAFRVDLEGDAGVIGTPQVSLLRSLRVEAW